MAKSRVCSCLNQFQGIQLVRRTLAITVDKELMPDSELQKRQTHPAEHTGLPIAL